jgi:hypothetical protein
MLNHHMASLERVSEHFQQDPEVTALLLGGSLAHGYARPNSDVDIQIIVSDADYERRNAEGRVHYLNRELCTYPEGYVDGKYLGISFLEQVAASGSEPARFAFDGARVLFSRDASVEELVRRIARYPVEGKIERIRRFYAQFEAWYWYVIEALKHDNRYLLNLSVSKLALFGGRLILAHNERLYPYHKWFLRVLADCPQKPEGLLDAIERLHAEPSGDNARAFYETVKDFREWEQPACGWPGQFVVDSEWNWMQGMTPVDDL